MVQNLSIHATSPKTKHHLQAILLPPLHAYPSPTHADPIPLLPSAIHIFNIEDSANPLIALSADTDTDADADAADPPVLGNCFARRAPGYVPTFATGPEAPPWLLVEE